MSWRDILGVSSPPESYTQNSQKAHRPDNNAYIADIALKESKLFEALATICRNIPITVIEVHAALSMEDIEDWYKEKVSFNDLAIFSKSLVQRRLMDQGKVPPHYIKKATCKQCGPIWLWFSGDVIGCPWCWNRISGKTIPRP